MIYESKWGRATGHEEQKKSAPAVKPLIEVSVVYVIDSLRIQKERLGTSEIVSHLLRILQLVLTLLLIRTPLRNLPSQPQAKRRISLLITHHHISLLDPPHSIKHSQPFQCIQHSSGLRSRHGLQFLCANDRYERHGD